MLFALLNID